MIKNIQNQQICKNFGVNKIKLKYVIKCEDTPRYNNVVDMFLLQNDFKLVLYILKNITSTVVIILISSIIFALPALFYILYSHSEIDFRGVTIYYYLVAIILTFSIYTTIVEGAKGGYSFIYPLSLRVRKLDAHNGVKIMYINLCGNTKYITIFIEALKSEKDLEFFDVHNKGNYNYRYWNPYKN